MTTRTPAVAPPSRPAVRRAEPEDVERVGWLVARALVDDPVARWVVPVGLHRRELWPRYLEHIVADALHAGTVLVAGTFDGVAVWVDGPGGRQSLLHPQALPYEVVGPYADRFGALEDEVRAEQPAARPHHRLAVLAVRDAARGQGLGGALLDAQHAVLDGRGLGAYVAPSTPAGARFLERSGYHRLAPPVRPQADAPPLWPMWRPAGAPR